MRDRVFHFFLTLLMIRIFSCQTFAQTTDDLFNGDILQEIRIYINPADYATFKQTNFLCEEQDLESLAGAIVSDLPRTICHFPIEFHWIFQGKDITGPDVDISSHGKGSRSNIKPSFKIEFDRYESQNTFLGLRALVLRADTQDASMMHERVAMTFFRKLGMIAPRECHTRLYINDQYAGLYTVVEYVDPIFLQTYFGESGGYLYSYEYSQPWTFNYLGPDTSQYSPLPFKPQTNLIDMDPTPIEAMVRTINQAPDAQFSAALSQYIDLQALFTEIAAEDFVSEQDGIVGDYAVNNFFFYRFQNTVRSIFIPWDKSNTFWAQNWDVIHNFTTNVLTSRALSIAPDLMAIYENALQHAVGLAGSGGWLEQEITKEYGQIRQAAYDDTLKLQDPGATGGLRPSSDADFDAEAQYLIQFARTRGDFDKWSAQFRDLTRHMPALFLPRRLARRRPPKPLMNPRQSLQMAPEAFTSWAVCRIASIRSQQTALSLLLQAQEFMVLVEMVDPATSAQLAAPSGIALDASGNLFIADSGNNRVRMINPKGVITTVAGNGTAGFSGDSGAATSAQLNGPVGVAVDAAGNLYIADVTNYLVRKVSNGVITTVAGNGTGGFSGDGGPATSAQIYNPYELKVDAINNLCVDAAGNLYIADSGNNRVREVTPAGVITTVAGTGTGGFSGDGGPATSAQLHGPTGVTVDAAGNLFIADSANHRVRKVTPTGVISTVAGNGNVIFFNGTFPTFGFGGDGIPATLAQLYYPNGVTVDAAGNLYIADSGNNRVRKVTPNGIITTIAGNGLSGF